MAGRLLDLQKLIRDPAHVFLARVKAYAKHVAELLDEAQGDATSAAANRACEVALGVLCNCTDQGWQIVSPLPALLSDVISGGLEDIASGPLLGNTRMPEQPLTVDWHIFCSSMSNACLPNMRKRYPAPRGAGGGGGVFVKYAARTKHLDIDSCCFQRC